MKVFTGIRNAILIEMAIGFTVYMIYYAVSFLPDL